MGWLQKTVNWFQKGEEMAVTATPQLRTNQQQPFRSLEGYVPLRSGESRLYRSIREGIPVVDAALLKLIRLTGGVQVACADQRAQAGLDRFLQQVQTGRGQRGLQSFLDCYLDSMLTYGRGVGELVLSPNGREIAAILCGSAEDLVIKEGGNPLNFALCTYDETGQIQVLPRQDLLLFTPFQAESDNPYGVSLLRSMPFMAGILFKIYQTIGLNWERMGNVRFAVVCKPGGDGIGQSYAKERSEQIAREWSRAMEASSQGNVRDFVAVGDVDIKVIGADNQILDSEVPVKQILEQLVSRTGIPPFLLGLSWSTTERMSTQQADMMTSELTALRRSLTPVVSRICELWLRLQGYEPQCTVLWEDINLQDLVDEALANLYRAEAEALDREGAQA